MTRFSAPSLPPEARYAGDVVCPSRWRGSMTDGAENPAIEIRVLAPHPDGGWLYEWIHDGEAGKRSPKRIGHCPDENLRRIFRPVGYANGEDGTQREETPA